MAVGAFSIKVLTKSVNKTMGAPSFVRSLHNRGIYLTPPNTTSSVWVVNEDYPRTLLELEKRFSSEEACAGYLAALRWPAGWICPRCAASEGWTVRRDHWLCGHCRYEMSVTADSTFRDESESKRGKLT